MAVTLYASETAIFGGSSIEMQVTIVNDSGSTATIQDVVILGGASTPSTFVRAKPLAATLANGATMVVPFVATFKAPKQLDPSTKRYLSFDCTAVAKFTVSGAYSETQSNVVRVNAINAGYPQAQRINGTNMRQAGTNLTSKNRIPLIPVVL